MEDFPGWKQILKVKILNLIRIDQNFRIKSKLQKNHVPANQFFCENSHMPDGLAAKISILPSHDCPNTG